MPIPNLTKALTDFEVRKYMLQEKEASVSIANFADAKGDGNYNETYIAARLQRIEAVFKLNFDAAVVGVAVRVSYMDAAATSASASAASGAGVAQRQTPTQVYDLILQELIKTEALLPAGHSLASLIHACKKEIETQYATQIVHTAMHEARRCNTQIQPAKEAIGDEKIEASNVMPVVMQYEIAEKIYERYVMSVAVISVRIEKIKFFANMADNYYLNANPDVDPVRRQRYITQALRYYERCFNIMQTHNLHTSMKMTTRKSLHMSLIGSMHAYLELNANVQPTYKIFVNAVRDFLKREPLDANAKKEFAKYENFFNPEHADLAYSSAAMANGGGGGGGGNSASSEDTVMTPLETPAKSSVKPPKKAAVVSKARTVKTKVKAEPQPESSAPSAQAALPPLETDDASPDLSGKSSMDVDSVSDEAHSKAKSTKPSEKAAEPLLKPVRRKARIIVQSTPAAAAAGGEGGGGGGGEPAAVAALTPHYSKPPIASSYHPPSVPLQASASAAAAATGLDVKVRCPITLEEFLWLREQIYKTPHTDVIGPFFRKKFPTDTPIGYQSGAERGARSKKFLGTLLMHVSFEGNIPSLTSLIGYIPMQLLAEHIIKSQDIQVSNDRKLDISTFSPFNRSNFPTHYFELFPNLIPHQIAFCSKNLALQQILNHLKTLQSTYPNVAKMPDTIRCHTILTAAILGLNVAGVKMILAMFPDLVVAKTERTSVSPLQLLELMRQAILNGKVIPTQIQELAFSEITALVKQTAVRLNVMDVDTPQMSRVSAAAAAGSVAGGGGGGDGRDATMTQAAAALQRDFAEFAEFQLWRQQKAAMQQATIRPPVAAPVSAPSAMPVPVPPPFPLMMINPLSVPSVPMTALHARMFAPSPPPTSAYANAAMPIPPPRYSDDAKAHRAEDDDRLRQREAYAERNREHDSRHQDDRYRDELRDRQEHRDESRREDQHENERARAHAHGHGQTSYSYASYSRR